MSAFTLQLTLLRSILETANARPIAAIARSPGVGEVYRLTSHTYDGRARDSVATLFFTRVGARVEVVYPGAFGGRPIVTPLDADRPTRMVALLRKAGFDRLPDQPDMPEYDAADVWFVERAAGTFAHSVIVMPTLASGPYALVVSAWQLHLPEALRAVT